MGGEDRERRTESARPDEAEAVAACLRGDRSAYELLVKRYAPRAVTAARAILGDASLAEEAAQEAFVGAYRALGRLDVHEPFYPWLYRVLKSVCLSARARRRAEPSSLDAPGRPSSDGASAATARGDVRERLFAAMRTLSEPHREILRLAHFDALSYKEIAACLALPVGTVMSRLWAARRALRQALGEALARE
jgi:RNA polymerase sigma-70 factor (ECF subfamily)